MKASHLVLAVIALALGAAHAAAAAPAAAAQPGAKPAEGAVMVCEMDLANEKNVDAKEIAKVFSELGADEAKVAPLLKRLGTAGDKALVTAGSKENCEMVAKKLEEIGMKVEIRPLSATDVPSAFDNSDVIPAGGEKMKEMICRRGESSPLSCQLPSTSAWGRGRGSMEPHASSPAGRMGSSRTSRQDSSSPSRSHPFGAWHTFGR